MSVPVSMIAAVARNGGIGFDNRLPWRLKGDLQRFRALTMGKPVIMGRKTFQSIGRPLPGRHLVVVSGDPAYAPPGVVLAPSPDAAVHLAAAIAAAVCAREVMVAGGATLYAALIGRATRLDITEVDLAPEADTDFPFIDPDVWSESAREPHVAGPQDDAAFSFVTYLRS